MQSNQTVERLKHVTEMATGLARPSKHQARALVRARKANSYPFRDDGETPNHPHYPLIHYRTAVDLAGGYDPAAVFEVLFGSHGWRDSWRDGMYPYVHFHTGTHEVLGIARGKARAMFGGHHGRTLALKAGDVLVLPAGVGHRRLAAARDFLVVGAYPEAGHYDEPRPKDVDRADAKAKIAKVPKPNSDPVYGRSGPLVELWRK